MQPGLSRAVPMGILGFLVGAALVLIIRALQSLDPVMDDQLVMIMGAFISTAFFVWGMGAFDPKMSEHAHEPGEHDDEHALALAEAHEAQEEPTQILGGYVWLVTTVLLVVILAIGVVAFLPTGLTLQIVAEAEGNTAAIGFAQWELFGQTFIVSELIILIGFVIFMMVSLAGIAGALGLLFFSLSRGVTEVQTVPATALPPAPLETREGTGARVLFLVMFALLAVGLFLLFYYVLIGIVLGPGPLNLVLSLTQAVPLAIIILRPRQTARFIGRAAAWLAKQLRRLPNALQ
jgi:hypothetical protein